MSDSSPVAFLEADKWQAALFTTYALSLSFFESVVLHRLRKVGCREIWVVVDAQGYRSSLMERRTQGVGLEYRLIPVALPRGVLHPKCTYLTGADGDLLMVGSGNLTFGGYGRNVEVLDLASSDQTPGLFRQFAAFLDALAARADFIDPDPSWLTRFAGLAHKAGAVAGGGDSPVGPWLLHSVSRSVLDQLVERVSAAGTPARIDVLSPFHDPKGEVVRRLAERTQCPRIAVGLPPSPDEETTFPFAATAHWPCTVEAVRPNLDEPKRPLHAKWIGLKMGGTDLVLTGSVNATSKSLGSIDNIEVSLLRALPSAGNTATWAGAAVPGTTRVLPRQPAGLGDNCILFARLNRNGFIEGGLLSLATIVPGLWAGKMQRPSGERAEFQAQVRGDGNFASTGPVDDQFWLVASVQVELIGDGCTARGWLHHEDALGAKNLRGVEIRALARLISREETEDDDIALLDYLAVSLGEHPGLLDAQDVGGTSAGSTAPARGAEADTEEGTIALALLKPFDEAVPSGGEVHLPTATDDPIHRLFALLRRRILVPASEHEAAPRRQDPVRPNETDYSEDPTDTTAGVARVRDSLDDFGAEVRSLVSEAPADLCRSLLVIWFEVSLHMYLRRLKDPASALRFVYAWFSRATDLANSATIWQALEDHVTTAAALISWNTATNPQEMAVSDVDLHERLERFFRGKLPSKQARIAVQEGSGAVFADLFGADQATRLAAFGRVMATRTLRQELQGRLQDFVARKPPVAESPLFDGPVGEALRKALGTWDGKERIRPLPAGQHGCPFCYCDLGPGAETLRHKRVLICGSCGRWIVDLTP